MGIARLAVIPPPVGDTHYLGHPGVSPSLRGNGLGSALVGHLFAAIPVNSAGAVIKGLATGNPYARRLLQRLGFEVIDERHLRWANAWGKVPDHRRMQWRRV